MAELRFCGVYLPASLILSRPLHTGWIVSKQIEARTWQSWIYTSLDPGQETSPLNPLMVHEARQNPDGTYLLRGMAWDAGYLNQWPQEWLCGPGNDAVTTALNGMEHWLQHRYTGAWGKFGS